MAERPADLPELPPGWAHHFLAEEAPPPSRWRRFWARLEKLDHNLLITSLLLIIFVLLAFCLILLFVLMQVLPMALRR